MFCPNCGKEMVSGTVQNITMNHMTLLFNKNGEEKRLRDLFKKDQIYTMVLAGSETEAFYCEECKKIITAFNVD